MEKDSRKGCKNVYVIGRIETFLGMQEMFQVQGEKEFNPIWKQNLNFKIFADLHEFVTAK